VRLFFVFPPVFSNFCRTCGSAKIRPAPQIMIHQIVATNPELRVYSACLLPSFLIGILVGWVAVSLKSESLFSLSGFFSLSLWACSVNALYLFLAIGWFIFSGSLIVSTGRRLFWPRPHLHTPTYIHTHARCCTQRPLKGLYKMQDIAFLRPCWRGQPDVSFFICLLVHGVGLPIGLSACRQHRFIRM